jgi:membrane-associated phospholipid phosphatase
VSIQLQLGAAAVVLFAVFLVLGRRLSQTELGRPDTHAIWFRGQLMQLAILFTRSGRSRAMTTWCIIAILVYAVLHLPIRIAIGMALSQLLSQIIVELFKKYYARVRPDYWLVGLEAGHSYPSGHSCTAIVFFIGWAIVVALGTLSGGVKAAAIAALALWAIGIAWSRLALGAHYLSDVCGGALFGCAWLAAILAIASNFFMVFSGYPGR